jgi:hypothetical protein
MNRSNGVVRIFFLIMMTGIIFLNSCATIINQRRQRIDIITDKPASVSINDHILLSSKNKISFVALRDIVPIRLTVFNDTLKKELSLEPRTSALYWINIFYNCGLGMLIDRNSPKRFAYPGRVFVSMTDKSTSFSSYNPFIGKGTLNLNLSLPWINNFVLNPLNETTSKNSLGFMGISVGADYYYRKNKFVNLTAGGVMNFFLPFPAAVDFSGEVDIMSSSYLTLSDNFRMKRFSAGFGLSLSKNSWNHMYYDWGNPPPPLRDPVKRTDISLGFAFPFYIQTSEYFSIGMLYRPSVLTIDPALKLKYNHVLSVDFIWKISLLKK